MQFSPASGLHQVCNRLPNSMNYKKRFWKWLNNLVTFRWNDWSAPCCRPLQLSISQYLLLTLTNALVTLFDNALLQQRFCITLSVKDRVQLTVTSQRMWHLTSTLQASPERVVSSSSGAPDSLVNNSKVKLQKLSGTKSCKNSGKHRHSSGSTAVPPCDSPLKLHHCVHIHSTSLFSLPGLDWCCHPDILLPGCRIWGAHCVCQLQQIWQQLLQVRACMLCGSFSGNDHILQVPGLLCHVSGLGSSRVQAHLLHWPPPAGVSGRDQVQHRKDWNTCPRPDVERRSSSSSENRGSHHLPLN